MTNSTDKHVTITLEKPVIRGKHEISELQLRKPQSGELRGLSLNEVLNADVSALHKLLPRVTSPALTEQDVSELDLSDLVELAGGIAGFFIRKQTQDSLTA